MPRLIAFRPRTGHTPRLLRDHFNTGCRRHGRGLPRARHAAGPRVAIKVLLPELAADPDYRERFEREARAISRLSHPHICALHDVGRATVDGDGGNVERQFLVMELLEGETLAARCAPRAAAARSGPAYAIQIADALAAAHRRASSIAI